MNEIKGYWNWYVWEKMNDVNMMLIKILGEDKKDEAK